MFRGQVGGGGLLREGIFPWPCGVQCAGQERSRHLYPAIQHGERERGMWLKRTQWREALNSTSEGGKLCPSGVRGSEGWWTDWRACEVGVGAGHKLIYCPFSIYHLKTHVKNNLPVYLLFFNCLVMSNSMWPHGLQHTRLPCPLLSPWICSNSCPLSQWCHPTISSFIAPFFSCPQSFSASGSFPVSQLFTSGGQSIGASASVSILSMNIQGWFPLRLTVWFPYCSGDSQEPSPTPWFESISSSLLTFLHGPTLMSIHDYWKNKSFD